MSATYACGFRQQQLMLHTSRTRRDASHARMEALYTRLDAFQTLHHTCSLVHTAGCMEVWVFEHLSIISHDPTSDAMRVNNPYLVPAVVTCTHRVLNLRP